MSISSSRLAYNDCISLMEKAIEDAKGARVCLVTWEACNFFRMRCHQARKIARKDNTEIYKPGEPLYGATPFDSLTLRIKEDDAGEYWVYAEKSELDPSEIETLSDMEE